MNKMTEMSDFPGWILSTSAANMRLLFLFLCIALLSSPLAVNAHHKSWNCKYPYSTLYVYTFPESKECVLLTHNGKVVQAQDQPPTSTRNSTDGGDRY